jgi:hypothetical protein
MQAAQEFLPSPCFSPILLVFPRGTSIDLLFDATQSRATVRLKVKATQASASLPTESLSLSHAFEFVLRKTNGTGIKIKPASEELPFAEIRRCLE